MTLLGDSFGRPFGAAWVVYFPGTETLLVLNQTGRSVWEMLKRGYGLDAIASTFVQHFGISDEQARSDVRCLESTIRKAAQVEDAEVDEALDMPADAPCATASTAPILQSCGTYQFGESRIQVLSSVEEIDENLFLRFGHRATDDGVGGEILEVSGSGNAYRIALGGCLLDHMATKLAAVARLVQQLLMLEHSQRSILAYCHAAAVSHAGRSLLMPGNSGVGKSTLTAFLVAKGFGYLGDDIIALAEDDWALLPLPTCLSIKTGSWPILEECFPTLRQLPTLDRYGREMRYVEPQGNYDCLTQARAPSAILFPFYKAGEATTLRPVEPLDGMVRLIGAHTALMTPATEARLAKLLAFVEQTPAFELTYCDLPGAKMAIEDLLATRQ